MIIEVKKLFYYHNDPPCGAVWSGLPTLCRGRSRAGRPCSAKRRTERKGLVKPDLLLQGFHLDTNLTTQKKQGNFSGPFFMNGHFLQLKQLAALLCRLCFFKRQSKHLSGECGASSQPLFSFSVLTYLENEKDAVTFEMRYFI